MTALRRPAGLVRSLTKVLLSLSLIGASGCIPSWVVRPATRDGMKPILVNSIDGFVGEPDLEIAEGAILSNVKLVEGVSRSYPDDRELLTMAAMARANYAFAFVQDELEAVRLAFPDDSARAEALVSRAAANFGLGKEHAEAALRMNDDFQEQVGDGPLDQLSDDAFRAAVAVLEEEDVGPLFWLAFNWGGKIQVRMDVQEATQLPKLQIALARILELDERFFYGVGPNLMAGVLHGFRAPALGGNPELARTHFERARELGGGVLLPSALLAQFVYAQTEDQEAFEATLLGVITSSTSRERALFDALAKRKACRLFANLDQFFLADPKPLPEACASVSHKMRLRPPG